VSGTTVFSSAVAEKVAAFTAKAATLPGVKEAVEANHDENRWWPTSISDPRTRMLIAGWSTRVSYAMVDAYARVAARTDDLGFDAVAALNQEELRELVYPLGLPDARMAYLRSLAAFLDGQSVADLAALPAGQLIFRLAAEVNQASFKVAQCAVLYARGYHCGIIPVDSGMVTKLAPALGLRLPTGPAAHEAMRLLLEAAVADRPGAFRRVAADGDFKITIPEKATPTWFAHLVLIYTKRLYLNRPGPRLCPRRPICPELIDCPHLAEA
jgi:hypothetical protein